MEECSVTIITVLGIKLLFTRDVKDVSNAIDMAFDLVGIDIGNVASIELEYK